MNMASDDPVPQSAKGSAAQPTSHATGGAVPPAAAQPRQPDPQLVNHVAKALADLRLLAGHIAGTADRRVPAADLLVQAQSALRSDPAAAADGLYQRVADTASRTAAEIASDPKATAELFFLLDRLSLIAWPASADSIRLTAAYLQYPMETETDGDYARAAVAASAQEATALRKSLRLNRGIMIAVFFMAVGLSIYALFGQVLLGERERIIAAIEREAENFYTQSRLSLPAQIFRHADQQHIFLVNPEEMANWVMQICPPIRMTLPSPLPVVLALPPPNASAQSIRIYPSTDYMRSCDQYEYLENQRLHADLAVRDWVSIMLNPFEAVFGSGGRPAPGAPAPAASPPATVAFSADAGGKPPLPSAQAAQAVTSQRQQQEEEAARGAGQRNGAVPRDYSYKPWGETIVTAMGSYILPILFGVIGAWAANERELRRKMERFEVTRTDRHTYRRGLLLGGVVGGVVGLFFSADSLKNLSLTYSAIALLGGFAGDRVFRFFDDLINRVFSINQPSPGGPAPASSGATR